MKDSYLIFLQQSVVFYINLKLETSSAIKNRRNNYWSNSLKILHNRKRSKWLSVSFAYDEIMKMTQYAFLERICILIDLKR